MAYYKCGRVYTTQNSNVVVDTASGAVANFNTSLALPLKSLKADVNAVQDLHGYDHPWVGGAGKNLVDWRGPQTITSQTTLTEYATSKQTQYTVSVYAKNTGSINARLKAMVYNDTTLVVQQGVDITPSTDGRISVTLDTTSYTYNKLRVVISGQSAGYEVTVSDLQIEEGSSATSFEPYENICPIEGWDSVEFSATGKNLLPKLENIITSRGVTFTPQTDGTILINGTATGGTATCDIGRGLTEINSGTYYVNQTTSPYTITVFSLVGGTTSVLKTGGGLFTVSERTSIFVRIGITSGTTVSNYSLALQLELGSTASDYEPYNGTTTPYLLPQTVYGGEIVKSKTGSVLRITGTKIVVTEQSNIQFAENENGFLFYVGTGEILLNNDAQFTNMGLQKAISASTLYWVENAFVVYPNGPAYFKFNNSINTVALAQSFLTNNPLEIYADYATPIEIPLSDLPEIVTKQGINNIWVDSGDTSLQFRKIG